MNQKNVAPLKASLIARIAQPAALAVITALVYARSLWYPFLFDDTSSIIKYFDIRHHTFGRLFLSSPRWISSWLNTVYYKINQFNPFYYRMGNLLIHITTGMLLYVVIYQALSGLRRHPFYQQHAHSLAMVVAALFLLHPVQTQTVTYVTQGQLEGLATMFMVAACALLLAYVRSTRSSMRALSWTMLLGVCFLACGSKEIAIITPALLLLIDWFFCAQGSWRSLKSRLMLHASVIGLMGLVYAYLLKPKFFLDIVGLNVRVFNNPGTQLTERFTEIITPWAFFISQFKVIVHYLWMFIWPFNVSMEYDWRLCPDILAPDCIMPALLLAGLCFVVFKLLKKDPIHPVAFGALWFAIAVLPRSSIIPSTELLVDYKTYTASIGWLFILSIALIKGYHLARHVLQRENMLTAPTQRAAAGVALSLLSWATLVQNSTWQSELTFWHAMATRAPNKARTLNNYGMALARAGQYLESIPYYEKAIAFEKYYCDARCNLAVAYAHCDKTDQAIDQLQQSIKIQPTHAESYNNLGTIYLTNKQFDKAIEILNQAIKVRPTYGKAYYNLARCHMEKSDDAQALHCFKQCCTAADLDNEVGFVAWGMMAMKTKLYDQACTAFERAARLKPNDNRLLVNLANAYCLAKNFAKASPLYEHLIKVQPDNHFIRYNAGEAYAQTGNYRQALCHFSCLESHQTDMPQLNLRIAACHQALGNHEKAQAVLKQLLTLKVPQEIKDRALAQLNQGPNTTAVA